MGETMIEALGNADRHNSAGRLDDGGSTVETMVAESGAYAVIRVRLDTRG